MVLRKMSKESEYSEFSEGSEKSEYSEDSDYSMSKETSADWSKGEVKRTVTCPVSPMLPT